MDKILVSACFLGKKVRYNAEIITLEHALLNQWQQEGRLVVVCPEVAGGLPTPRPPAEIQVDKHSSENHIITITGIDVSQQFQQGAKIALTLCQQHNIRFALLKESSPSCGSNQIYDGSFSDKKVIGQGITTKLLQAHGILVFSEQTIEALSDHLDGGLAANNE